MWVSSTSPPNLSLIGLLTTDIYYRTGITGNTDTQTDTQTETDVLPIYQIESSKKKNFFIILKIKHIRAR